MEGRALQPTAMRILDFYDRHPISESQVLDAVRRVGLLFCRLHHCLRHVRFQHCYD